MRCGEQPMIRAASLAKTSSITWGMEHLISYLYNYLLNSSLGEFLTQPKGSPNAPLTAKEGVAEGGLFLTYRRIDNPPDGWHFALYFTGRFEGMENVIAFDGASRVELSGPLGLIAHFLRIRRALPRIPARIWSQSDQRHHSVRAPGLRLRVVNLARARHLEHPLDTLLQEFFDESKRGIDVVHHRQRLDIGVIFSKAPRDDIVKRVALVAENFDPAHYASLVKEYREVLKRDPASLPRADRSRWVRRVHAPLEYYKKHSRLIDIWYARDAVAAGWCEIFHAMQTGASGRRCKLCSILTLRPKGYPVKFCPTCGELTWRQRDRVREQAPPDRRKTAIALFEANMTGSIVTPW
jgi:hypothetical protein